MTDWGTIGGVAAMVSAASIPLVLSSTSSKLLSSAYRYLVSSIIPSKGRCTRLLWDDMESQKFLHECDGYFCTHKDSHSHPSSKCWQRTLGIVFSRAWRSPARQYDTVPKPKILPLNGNYVCTDARTVLAFILCTVDYKGYGSPGIPWSPEDLRFASTHVRIRELAEGTVVAHLEGFWKNNLTKEDIEGLLAGYPPWYRKSVCLPHGPSGHGPSVAHPIVSPADIFRAGWVVAVGLTDVEPLSAVPRDGDLTDKPIKRTYEILQDRLLPVFPNDTNVKSAANALWHLAYRYTESGVEVHLNGEFGKERSDAIQKLSGSDATFAMKLFNEAPTLPLTPDDTARLTSILLPVVDAAFRGACKIVALLKNEHGQSFYWPSLLRDPERRVFVEDCA